MTGDDQKNEVVFRRFQPERSVTVLKSLSNRVRVHLLYGLAQDREVKTIVEDLGITEAEAEFHLHTLRTYGLLNTSDAGLGGKGIWLVSFLEEVSEKLSTPESVDIERECERCGGQTMHMDVYPDHFKMWCPGCREKGVSEVHAYPNTAGYGWRERNLDDLIAAGKDLAHKVFATAVEKNICLECGTEMKFAREGNRVRGQCPCCFEQYAGPVRND